MAAEDGSVTAAERCEGEEVRLRQDTGVRGRGGNPAGTRTAGLMAS